MRYLLRSKSPLPDQAKERLQRASCYLLVFYMQAFEFDKIEDKTESEER